MWWRTKKKEEEQIDKSEKEEKKEKKKEQLKNSGEERKKKKGQKLQLTLTSESLHVCLITKMPLETEFWKMKTPKLITQKLEN